jgi:hypothetical protein
MVRGASWVLVGNNCSAVGVSVTATISSPRIVTDHPSNISGLSWALPGVSETATLDDNTISGDVLVSETTGDSEIFRMIKKDFLMIIRYLGNDKV